MFRYFILSLIMVGLFVPSMAKAKEFTLLCEGLMPSNKRPFKKLITINTDEGTSTVWWVKVVGQPKEQGKTNPLIGITPDKIWFWKNPLGYEYLDRRTGLISGRMGKFDMNLECEEARKPRLKF